MQSSVLCSSRRAIAALPLPLSGSLTLSGSLHLPRQSALPPASAFLPFYVVICLLVLGSQIEYPEIDDNIKPRHRFMSAYEQRVETWDKKSQYLLFAAEPYEASPIGPLPLD